MKTSSSANALLRHPVLIGLAVALIALILLFDWNWFRGPLERYISKKIQREFSISDLDVDLGLTPTIRMKDVRLGNAAWSKAGNEMLRIDKAEFSVAVLALPQRIEMPLVSLTKPYVLLEKLADDKKNWIFGEPHPDGKSTFKLIVRALTVDQGQLQFINHSTPFSIDIKADTLQPASQPVSEPPAGNTALSGNAPGVSSGRYALRYAFSGKYQNAGFSGEALTGQVVSLQQSGAPFAVKGHLKAGGTTLDVEGTIADIANLSAIDAQVHIKGTTLANLYPFLLLPLPASPPYQLQGRLVLAGDRYAMDNLSGKIGSTDVTGKAAYVNKEPRPLLTADLHSKLLNISDLGPLIGVQTKGSGGKTRASQAETSSRSAAVAKQNAVDPNHILPSGTFDGARLQKIDADVDLIAAKLEVPVDLPLESLKASLRLKNGVLKIDPLNFGFAGGVIESKVMLDGREPTITVDATVNMRRIKLAQLMPEKNSIAQGGGLLGASVQIKGVGNSIADAAAKANGKISAAVSDGRVSNLLDAASGLNGGKVLQLLAGGDQTIKVNCGGFNFDIKDGQGKSSLFVIDTEQSQILGDGGFNLARETFDITVAPKPKKVSILSLRTPVRAFGTFKNPDYELVKGPLLARAGGALALLAVAPLAALIPLLETGPGENTDCSRLQQELASAEKQATTGSKKAAPAAPRMRKSP